MKLTKWIPGNVKPVRVGVYERFYDRTTPWRSIRYSYWNGKFWGVYADTPEEAKRLSTIRSLEQTLPWRGLARKPE